MSQTSISAGGQARGDAGEMADSTPAVVDSGFNEETTELPWGVGLRDGTGERQYKLASGFSGTLPITGILLRRANYQQRITLPNGQTVGDFGGSGLVQYAPLNVLRKGKVLVPCEAAVTFGHGGWCRGVATGGGVTEQRGMWRGAARGAAGPLGASYHVDASKQTVFRSASFTAADGTTTVAVLEVDFVNGPF